MHLFYVSTKAGEEPASDMHNLAHGTRNRKNTENEKQQEALLPQRDCTMHCVSWNLVDCCTHVQCRA